MPLVLDCPARHQSAGTFSSPEMSHPLAGTSLLASGVLLAVQHHAYNTIRMTQNSQRAFSIQSTGTHEIYSILL